MTRNAEKPTPLMSVYLKDAEDAKLAEMGGNGVKPPHCYIC